MRKSCRDIVRDLLKKGEIKQSELPQEYFKDETKSEMKEGFRDAFENFVKVGKIAKSEDANHIYSWIDKKITSKELEEISSKSDERYHLEGELLRRRLLLFPKNECPDIIALKIALIDITNTTHLAQHKSKINVVELSRIIAGIEDIDKKIEKGEPEVVEQIAKCNGKINLFSFASKYCCYHNRIVYNRDDYAIYDSVLTKYLPYYFPDDRQNQIEEWRKAFNYKAYNKYIEDKLKDIDINDKKRKFDYFVWYKNRI